MKGWVEREVEGTEIEYRVEAIGYGNEVRGTIVTMV